MLTVEGVLISSDGLYFAPIRFEGEYAYISFSARRHNVAAIAAALGVDPNMNEQGQPPSLARFALVDGDTEQIKDVDGRFFADPDAPDRLNTVDVIDFPSGFNYVDFSGDNLILNTERFMVEQDMAECAESPTTHVVHAMQTESTRAVSDECLP